ncbi:4-(cytidine 5'-diphospho)-2-C-methyl-D-erythritol kinase [Bacteroides sp. 224]|uniref:4-(cytidine 5'-diphospho)-2-C-methyl-D-erythritol kinase n=1 Tax=Bacteroides sp. 224 TaxID=2302936 RepID=UPI0013D8A6FD|nr:4-(cytidine 5'-diphospho)-2-C-methyl-D-erythritol kinase [Bacteroides sp. 224]NDV65887.1 4-(cytidine 5'-diphospho)-2-C-methyl-D-erythritol kinase [Bacteroides sp. 224]
MITFPNAKINLGLNITEKRPDGYHNLETIFYPIPWEDALEINPLSCSNKEKIILHQSGITIEGNPDDNLIAKAYHLLDKDFGLPSIETYIHKHIPTGAGLGGGSSDAAFMLKLLNEQFQLSISDEKLEEYAAILGADCAFFIKNKPTYAEGIGNVFSPISLSLKGYHLFVIKPDVFISTRDAFAAIKPHKPAHSLKKVITRPVSEWKNLMINDFEESVFPKFPLIAEIKETLYNQGAIYASMSGSGSSVYGIFSEEVHIELLKDKGVSLQMELK